MRHLASALLAVAALFAAASEPAAQPRPSGPPAHAITISDAWAPATPGGASVAAGYLTLTGGVGADRLIGVSSPRARAVEIHEMTMTDGMMQMRPIDGLAIPAGGSVALEPGGLHLMFLGITAPFVAGERVPLTLRFEHAGEIRIELPVRTRGQQSGARSHEGH